MLGQNDLSRQASTAGIASDKAEVVSEFLDLFHSNFAMFFSYFCFLYVSYGRIPFPMPLI